MTKPTDPPSMILLFKRPVRAVEPTALARALRLSGPLATEVQVTPQPEGPGTLHLEIAFDGHRFRLVGFDAPAPKGAVGNAIECSHWKQKDKEPLRAHTAHVVTAYLGEATDPSDRQVALLRLAGALFEAGLVGVVDEDAWNCLPAHALREMLKPGSLAECRETIPLGLWTGFVKMFKTEEDVWFCTKAYPRWGVPNFAFFGKHDQAEEAFALLSGLFSYVRGSGATIKIGDTAQFGELLLRFEAVTEFPDYLEGPLGTRVVRLVTPAERH